MQRSHRLDPGPDTVHWGYFDARLPARLEVDSGDTVIVDTVSGAPEVVPDESLYRPEHREIVTKLKPILGGHILTGPVAVRGAEPDTLIVADGTSCRHQIHDGTKREALHVARVLAMSLDRAETNSTSLTAKEPSHG